jgi:hypothetical protein
MVRRQNRAIFPRHMVWTKLDSAKFPPATVERAIAHWNAAMRARVGKSIGYFVFAKRHLSLESRQIGIPGSEIGL